MRGMPAHGRLGSRPGRVMRGAWAEHEDPELLTSVAEALEGSPVDDITRRPATVMRRIAGRPSIALELIADAGKIRRVYESDTDSWRYTSRGES